MIRLTLLAVVVAMLAAYAWRDWYKSACGLIVLCAFVEHPDMPKQMFGISGVNPWNLLLLMVALSWLLNRHQQGLIWQVPKRVNTLLLLYLVVILVGFGRMIQDMGGIHEYSALLHLPSPTRSQLVSDSLINSVKWVIPGLLICDGCRSQERLLWATGAILLAYFLLALQVIAWMPVAALVDGQALSDRAVRVLDAKVGYHRVDLAALLAGGTWAMINARALTRSHTIRLLLLVMAGTTLLGLALTGGRTGYATWIALGALLGFVRWRKMLFLAPIAIFVVMTFVPAARDRMMQGFDGDVDGERIEKLARLDMDTSQGVDLHAITSGRILAWPFVVDEIKQAPFIGYGRMAMQRQGISTLIIDTYGPGENFRHPHNAYLELVLDNGLIGAIPIALLYWLVLINGLRYFKDKSNANRSTVGAFVLCIVSAQLIASFGSQSFYPRVGLVTMWCAFGLLFRIWSDEQRGISDWSNKELDRKEPVQKSRNTRRRRLTHQ